MRIENIERASELKARLDQIEKEIERVIRGTLTTVNGVILYGSTNEENVIKHTAKLILINEQDRILKEIEDIE